MASSVVAEYNRLTEEELDFQIFLSKMLSFLSEKVGSTDSIVCVPRIGDEYTVGGYVGDKQCMTLASTLIDTIVPRLHRGGGLIHLTDNAMLHKHLGDDAAFFVDMHVLAFACKDRNGTMAVVCLFRDGRQPFSEDFVEECLEIGRLTAGRLARINRVYHRMNHV